MEAEIAEVCSWTLAPVQPAGRSSSAPSTTAWEPKKTQGVTILHNRLTQHQCRLLKAQKAKQRSPLIQWRVCGNLYIYTSTAEIKDRVSKILWLHLNRKCVVIHKSALSTGSLCQPRMWPHAKPCKIYLKGSYGNQWERKRNTFFFKRQNQPLISFLLAQGFEIVWNTMAYCQAYNWPLGLRDLCKP